MLPPMSCIHIERIDAARASNVSANNLPVGQDLINRLFPLLPSLARGVLARRRFMAVSIKPTAVH